MSSLPFPLPRNRSSNWTNGLLLGLTTIQAYFGVRAYRNSLDCPIVEPLGSHWPQQETPRVSVIIPARNEAHNVDRVLGSLALQDYPNYEVILVDDASSDGTGELASRYPVKVVRNEQLPSGWVGKVYACHLGQQSASGEWLAFVDADTLHQEGSLSAAIAFMQTQDLDCACIIPWVECPTYWQRALMPWILFLYSLSARVRRVNTVGDPAVAGIGQYMLFRRCAYDALGGHEAVRGSILEDVDLAKIVKKQRRRYFVASGERIVSVLMHRSFREAVGGHAKNAAPWIGRSEVDQAVGLSAVASLVSVGVIVRGIRHRSRVTRVLALITYLVPAVAIGPHSRRHRVSVRYGLFHPVATGFMLLTILKSIYRALIKGSVEWKGRECSTRTADKD